MHILFFYIKVSIGLVLFSALGLFYDSQTFALMSEGTADMHCMSDEYLAEELMIEYGKEIAVK